MHLSQHGTLEKMTVLQVLARGAASFFSARSSGDEHAVSALRHWGAMKSSADSEPTGPQQQIKMRGGSGVMMDVWRRGG